MAQDSLPHQQINHLSTQNYDLKTRQYFVENKLSAHYFLNEVCKNAGFEFVVDKYDLDHVKIHALLAADEAFKNSIDAALNVAKRIALSKLYKRGVYGYVDVKEDGKGNVIERNRKHSDRCLLEYIKFAINNPQNHLQPKHSEEPPLMKHGDTMEINTFNE